MQTMQDKQVSFWRAHQSIDKFHVVFVVGVNSFQEWKELEKVQSQSDRHK